MGKKFADIWDTFIPLRTEVRKAVDGKYECEASVLTEWQNVRNHIVAQNYNLVREVAETMAKKIREVDVDTLASLGVDGLYDAIDGFDTEADVKFETYAGYRIKGSVLDGLRREDWVPRLVRSRAKQMAEKREQLEAKLGRSVTDGEMAKELNMPVEKYQQLLNSSSVRQVQSLNTTFISKGGERFNDDMPMIDCLHDTTTPEPGDIMEQAELTAKLFGKGFTPLERKIIYAYYYEGRCMKEIADMVGLSESRVSQMNSSIIKRLREKIERNPEYFGPQISGLLKK